ncbi:MAG: hypothetical protein A2787_05480 [Omnitrophica WOR_2 bacterium RIFCSPHIGHO2_01_FULL_48_9]|nr:MAG: hypothetical protein A3D10_06225 [Omnitrophica WOR_2 bacterium RIFCSPHIGHO2_02_FULL_48_11]OGX32831.1 MAG: hypothetical protein A2787_05480 [Omnitrophica WOR_2 bacterium RIFCSPHIGHO2_01_FULL_48_9]
MGHANSANSIEDQAAGDEAGQAIVEFTFSMLIVFIMIYAIVGIYQWTGIGLAERRMAHENSLIVPIVERHDAATFNQGPVRQLDPFFYKPRKLRVIWDQ